MALVSQLAVRARKAAPKRPKLGFYKAGLDKAGFNKNKETEIQIPPDVSYLAVVRDFVAAVARQDAFADEQSLDRLQLATSEAVTNAIAAHLQNPISAKTPIRISCRAAWGRMEVQVHDKGLGFNPAKVPEPLPAEHPDRLQHERGLGIYLIRAMADSHQIRSRRRGTRVSLSVVSSVVEPPQADS